MKTQKKDEVSKNFSFTKEEFESFVRGLGMSLLVASLTALTDYMTVYITGHNFGVYTPLVIAGWGIIANFVRKFVLKN
jgi:hypothetical protein